MRIHRVDIRSVGGYQHRKKFTVNAHSFHILQIDHPVRVYLSPDDTVGVLVTQSKRFTSDTLFTDIFLTSHSSYNVNVVPRWLTIGVGEECISGPSETNLIYKTNEIQMDIQGNPALTLQSIEAGFVMRLYSVDVALTDDFVADLATGPISLAQLGIFRDVTNPTLDFSIAHFPLVPDSQYRIFDAYPHGIIVNPGTLGNPGVDQLLAVDLNSTIATYAGYFTFICAYRFEARPDFVT